MNSISSGEIKNSSDEALAVLAQNGNREAENELVVRLLPTVKFLVGTFSTSDNSVGEDDFVQVALLGVLSAIHSFDPSRGVRFITFASRCATNGLLSFSDSTNKHVIPVVGLDALSQVDSSSPKPEQQVVDEEDYNRFIQSIRDALTETELNVLTCYLRGMDYSLISTKTGLSEKAVDNALYRARKKIKALR